jgi:hypothetical protein
MQKCSIKIECQEISQSQITKHKQCQQKAAKNCHPQNNWGQSNINLVNQKGKRPMGADDLWYPTMRKPPLASSPFDWKLMLF